MIEYGLRIAEKRSGNVQKRGVRELRGMLEKSIIEDPALSSEISATNYTIPESVQPEVREIVGDALRKQLIEAQGLGPIRRGLAFASVLSYGGDTDPDLEHARIVENLRIHKALADLEKEGFIDKDFDQA